MVSAQELSRRKTCVSQVALLQNAEKRCGNCSPCVFQLAEHAVHRSQLIKASDAAWPGVLRTAHSNADRILPQVFDDRSFSAAGTP
jgi:hypothetical protein